jgi:hypothetical protein
MQNLRQINSKLHGWPRIHLWIWLPLILLTASLVYLGMAGRPVYAHGGVIIDSGYTPQYEWLVAINPYPTTPGPTTITILVYDVQTHRPVIDLQAKLLLATPASTEPCCKQGVHIGPLPLLTDPALYPGDYSTIVDLDQVGHWAGLVQMTAGEQTVELEIGFDVLEGDSATGALVATTAVDAGATATVFAANVESARQATSPVAGARNSAQVNSPLAGSAVSPKVAVQRTLDGWLNGNWWLMGIVLLVPVVAVFVWALRPKAEE